MSVATAFRFAEAFPFCVTDISGSVPGGFNYIDNLTLADIMPFAWNLEDFEIITEGSVDYGGGIVADGNSTTNIYPMTSDRFDTGSTGGDMFFGDPLTAVLFGSWPAIRQPLERVCPPSTASINGALLDFGGVYSTDPGEANCEFGLLIGTDPVNAGKYRLYYELDCNFSDPLTESVNLWYKSLPMGSGMTTWNSGTFTIAGLTFEWYSGYSNTGSPSLTGTGTVTASSTVFTY